MNKLGWLFNLFLFIGAGAYVISFFHIIPDFFEENRTFFLAILWIGMLGILSIKYRQKENN